MKHLIDSLLQSMGGVGYLAGLMYLWVGSLLAWRRPAGFNSWLEDQGFTRDDNGWWTPPES